MIVLTRNNQPLTITECQRVYTFRACCAYDQDPVTPCDPEKLEGQDTFIQEWFDLWCGGASVEHDLHPDDDRDQLWELFCKEVAAQ